MKKYFIVTYGCQMNESDSERIESALIKKKYAPASSKNEADLIIINSCSVRQSAVNRVYGQIIEIGKRSKARIIVTGCLLENDRKKILKNAEFLNINNFFKLFSPENSSCYFNIRPKIKDISRSFVPIMTGCDNFCAYCVVPYTRGREKSRSPEKIINEIKKLIENGSEEICLLGQNVNSYKGGSKTSNFAALLRKINALEGQFKIKFLTSHPKDMSDDLIDAIADCSKVAKEIHLPIQSGDNEILKKMNRRYTVAQYKNLIKKIRRKIPEALISTDIIVGFPGETKKCFENTSKLIKETGFSNIYVAKYSPRPGTAAFSYKDDVPISEKKRRWNIISGISKCNRKTKEKK